MVELNKEQHEPTEVCQDYHCYSHHVDEDGDAAYIFCPECFHVYPTKEDLVAAYNRTLPGNSGRTAETIYWCPECGHDF